MIEKILNIEKNRECLMRDLFEDSSSQSFMNSLHPTLLLISEILGELGLKVFVIGARSIVIHGLDLGRETKDWDIAVDKPFTPPLRDKITNVLRMRGFKVQWRKWGFIVTDNIHVDINYAPLTLDEEFLERCRAIAKNILLPCIEDLIVLKLMSGERKDIDDVKRILQQSWNKLDKEYFYKRVQGAGLEKELEKILRRLEII